MKNHHIINLGLGLLVTSSVIAGDISLIDSRWNPMLYTTNRAPLAPSAYVHLPFGAIKPAGWLKDQLQLQADGLVGNLHHIDNACGTNIWAGGSTKAIWYISGEYFESLVDTALLTDDAALQRELKKWIEAMIASVQPNGWFGPAGDKSMGTRYFILKGLVEYYEATNDERVFTLIQEFFRYLANEKQVDWKDQFVPDNAMETMIAGYWLYNRTGDTNILTLGKTIHEMPVVKRWSDLFLHFPANTLPNQHAATVALTFKAPVFWYLQTGDAQSKAAALAGMESVHRYHDQVGGRFSGDEHMSGRAPTQGTELCEVVDYLHTLAQLFELWGDPAYAERMEVLAYNSIPGTCTPDMWAHQYDQQANQVLVSKAKRHWSSNSDGSNLYGLAPHHPCCMANMGTGWPRFIAHLWMATSDHGVIAVAYGPSIAHVRVGASGDSATITEETDYPFDGTIRFDIATAKPTSFPIHLRIPSWATGASYTVAGQRTAAAAGTVVMVNRTWSTGDRLTLELPMGIRTETRFNNATAILRGPLYFSLRIGQEYRSIAGPRGKYPSYDYEIVPTTAWNYALQIDRDHPDTTVQVMTNRVSAVPFAQKNEPLYRKTGSDKTPSWEKVNWSAPEPVILKVKGALLPDWEMKDNSADTVPQSPVHPATPLVDLELIPYGSTRLRISEFPVLEPIARPTRDPGKPILGK